MDVIYTHMTSIEYFYNTKGRVIYYEYEGQNYAPSFPIDWASDHMPNTGPGECKNCKYFGSWENIFMGYCANCANYIYEGERGKGFINICEEFDIEDDEPNPIFYPIGLRIEIPSQQSVCHSPSSKLDEMIESIGERDRAYKEYRDQIEKEWVKSRMDDLYDNIEYYG